VLSPDVVRRWAFACLLDVESTLCFLDSIFCLVFVYFQLVFKCVTCKTRFLQYKWNYVNSACIFVKSMFISPILNLNWQLEMVVSDRQQTNKHNLVKSYTLISSWFNPRASMELPKDPWAHKSEGKHATAIQLT
jgi:hypothetical protein